MLLHDKVERQMIRAQGVSMSDPAYVQNPYGRSKKQAFNSHNVLAPVEPEVR